MTYIQITTKCNMECDHCGYSCNENGIHMPMNTFYQAAKIAEELDEGICIGGGEPTLHPNFWEILGLSLGSVALDDIGVFIATNGSITDTSIKLAHMAKSGILSAALSLDIFHYSIDDSVKEAFGQHRSRTKSFPGYGNSNDRREIRDVSNNVANMGRAIEFGLGVSGRCICPEIFINPKGMIYLCGCQDYVLGTVWDYEIPEWYSEMDERCSEFIEEHLNEEAV